MSTDTMYRDFLRTSALLTGYSSASLEGTGQAETYLFTLQTLGGPDATTALLSAACGLLDGGDPGEDGFDDQVYAQIFDDPQIGPLATNLMRMWFIGAWYQMPDGWHDQYGGDPWAQSHMISPATYREGLVWHTIGAHPQGAKQPGFGTWAFPPPSPERA